MKMKQLFDADTGTYTYILWDEATNEAAIIDPVREQFDRDVAYVNELGVNLKYVLETHVHADHVTSSGQLREKFGAKVVLHEASRVTCADVLVTDGDVLKLGEQEIKVLHTPGHTDACTTFEIEGAVFTGDALLIRGTGRTDFQAGDSATLYRSIADKIFTLPDETVVYPGHDYKGFTASTVGEEKAYNPRMGDGQTEQGFVELMDSLKFDPPKRIKESLPGNNRCGLEVH